jgi:hypothetical protein
MTTMSVMVNGRGEAIIDGLRAEFGAIMAERILEAEACDFLWEARLEERYLGQHIDLDFGAEDEEAELARVAILSLLGGRWHVAACLVDGEGNAVDLLWKQSFDDISAANIAFDRAA